MSRAQSWPLPITFHLVALDSYLKSIGIYFQVSSSSISLKSLQFLFESFSCKIRIQLFTDAFCHEMHWLYFLVDSAQSFSSKALQFEMIR